MSCNQETPPCERGFPDRNLSHSDASRGQPTRASHGILSFVRGPEVPSGFIPLML